jgi:MarR family transcriptional regulator, organic hydroperoxide resistance regulator
METSPEPRPANGLAPSPPTHTRVTFLIHQVNAKIAQVANPLFRIHALDLVSSRIVVLLLEHHEMRVGELVETMVLPQSTISHQVLKLEKRGLVRRRRAADDNRAVAVSLTPKGEAVARECNQLSLAVYRHIVDGLSDAEADVLRALLGKMFAALGSFAADGALGKGRSRG